MNFSLTDDLTRLVISWIIELEEKIRAEGMSLSETEILDARAVGVKSPEKIRILKVDSIPFPKSRKLKLAIKSMLNSRTTSQGLTAGYGVLMTSRSRQILLHELVHVAQYEENGGIKHFIPLYIDALIKDGYVENRFEREARLLRRFPRGGTSEN